MKLRVWRQVKYTTQRTREGCTKNVTTCFPSVFSWKQISPCMWGNYWTPGSLIPKGLKIAVFSQHTRQAIYSISIIQMEQFTIHLPSRVYIKSIANLSWEILKARLWGSESNSVVEPLPHMYWIRSPGLGKIEKP